MRIRAYFALLLLSIFAVSGLHAQTGVLSIVVRDSKSHNPMQAKVRIEGPKTLETETDKDGKLTLSLPTGEYQFEFAALGYITDATGGAVRPINRPVEIFLTRIPFPPPISGGTGVLRIEVRDNVTGHAVPARLQFEGTKSLSIETDGNGTVTLPSGEYLEKVSAPGYKTMWGTSLRVSPGRDNPVAGAGLDPVTPPEEETPEALKPLLRPGYTLLHEYVVDSETGAPLAGVQVSIGGGTATTDSQGHFAVSFPTPEPPIPDGMGTATLTYKRAGYKTFVIRNFSVATEEMGPVAIKLLSGSGTIEEDGTHPLQMQAPAGTPQGDDPAAPTSPSLQGSPEVAPGAAGTGDRSSNLSSGQIAVPTTIKVGHSCSLPCGKCPIVCATWDKPTPLETYATNGLPSEWEGNWVDDSLKAGAVAYRSYGAWYVAHPLSPNYDICDNAFCQVYNPSKFPPTPRSTADVSATAGVVVSQDGVNIFKAEYAQNGNGLFCGDGQTGQPGYNWSCMPDPIAAGTQGSGHGRGMGQWPSEWWASGYNPNTGARTTPACWQCILDHYYNDNGNSSWHETGKRTSFLYEVGQIGYGPSPDGVIAYAPANTYPSRPLAGGLSSRTRRTGPADDLCGTYYAYSDLYTMLLDGTNLVDITPNKCNQYPVWAPTQKQIVHNRYTSDPAPWAISIINFDGTDDTPFLYDWPWLGQDWSLENVIVYNNNGLYSINPDGSNGFQVNSDQYSADPSWSPGNGLVSLIAYDTCVVAPGNCSQEIFVINANGGQPAQLTSFGNNWAPSWSPDGTKIVYLSDASGSSEVWVMNSDGSYQTQLTFFSVQENLSPHWSQDGHYMLWLSWNWYPAATTSLKIMSPDGTNQYSFGQVLPAGNAGGSMDTTRCRRFDSL